MREHSRCRAILCQLHRNPPPQSIWTRIRVRHRIAEQSPNTVLPDWTWLT